MSSKAKRVTGAGALELIPDNPTGQDQTTMDDPEPPPEAQPAPGSAAITMDAESGAITHIPQDTRGRLMSLPDLLGFARTGTWDKHGHGEKPGPDSSAASAMTGTRDRPERWTRDDALQVRQLAPTSFASNQVTTPVNGSATQLAPERPERMTIIIQNIDAANSVYIGSSSSVNAMSGFPIPAGGVLHLDATCGLHVSSAAVAGVSPAVTVAILDQFRTDVDAD